MPTQLPEKTRPKLSPRLSAKPAGPGPRKLDYWLSLSLYMICPAPIALLALEHPSSFLLLKNLLVSINHLSLAYLISSPQAMIYALAMSQARRHGFPFWLRLILSGFGGALTGAALEYSSILARPMTLIGLVTGLLVESLVTLVLLGLARKRAGRS